LKKWKREVRSQKKNFSPHPIPLPIPLPIGERGEV